jgi:hypothetical protein
LPLSPFDQILIKKVLNSTKLPGPKDAVSGRNTELPHATTSRLREEDSSLKSKRICSVLLWPPVKTEYLSDTEKKQSYTYYTDDTHVAAGDSLELRSSADEKKRMQDSKLAHS